jgi:Zn-dependent peptidase ImmA (M78 family)
MAAGEEKTYRDKRAHALRAEYRALWPEEPLFPVPVEAIAEDYLGLRVERRSLGETSGLLYPSERRILVNNNEAPVRQRFTIAHELGHWVCQCLEGSLEPIYCRADDVDESAKHLEREANVFAAELLMPEDAVRASDENIFGVSDLAYRWRLYSFGLALEPPAH